MAVPSSSTSTGRRQRLAKTRKTSVRLHRHLARLRTSIRRFEIEAGRGLDAGLHLATGRLLQRLDGLDHDIIAMHDRSHLLQEEVTLKLAEETNRHLHVLAIVTTLYSARDLDQRNLRDERRGSAFHR